MFDPFRIYHREHKKTSNGQIIRKKPVILEGSVSTKDLPLIQKYAAALGYDLVSTGYVPPTPPQPAPQFLVPTFYFINYGNTTRSLYEGYPQITLNNVRSQMDGTESILNLPSDLVDIINKFTIYISLNTVQITAGGTVSTVNMNTYLLNDSGFTFNLEPGETLVLTHSELYNGRTRVIGKFLSSTIIDTYYGTGLPLNSPVGPVGQQTYNYTGHEAYVFYQNFRNQTSSVLNTIPIFSVVSNPAGRSPVSFTFNYSVFMYVEFNT